jgi:hypothetical protein
MSAPAYSPFQLLQSALPDYAPEGTRRKLQLLGECSRAALNGARRLQEYHDTLLFLLSYADNHAVYERAENEMHRLTSAIKRKRSLTEQLTGSGIAGTVIQGAYSLTLITWLLREFSDLSLHSFDEGGVHPKEVLKFNLPEAEFELLADEKLNPVKWLEKASGTKNRNKILQWLVNSFGEMTCPALIKEQLFESLKLFVEIAPPGSSSQTLFSRSYNSLHVTKHFYHSDGIVKRFDEAGIINKKLPPEKKLSNKERGEIIKTSRVALCLLNRETDPVTYCDNSHIKYFELERGLSIALFSMDKERRMPLESYIGFMMFKNGYPMAYGGAWLFGKRSLIGINIFEAFRGGESAMVFAQLLRCYHMAFGADYFEVEPYQFGKNNPEGIQSGAFWFYYRFGFKPCDSDLYDLSLRESEKIKSIKGYRSPAEILKQFTKSNLFAHFGGANAVPLNPSALSKFITHKINTSFSGDRRLAQEQAVIKLKNEKIITGKESESGLLKLALFFAYCVDTGKLTSAAKKLLNKALTAKGANEFEYVKTIHLFTFEKNLSAEAKQFLS